ncbi:sushi domain-containing protein 4-like [Lissotriton helveticus]
MQWALFTVLALALVLADEEYTGFSNTYWAGTTPICLGQCRVRDCELRRDRCRDGSCCLFGYKVFCRVNCGKPESDFNSVVHGSDWWVGSVVRYECRPGFLLQGDAVSTCLANGNWSPKPSCLRIYLSGRLEMNERDFGVGCTSKCTNKSYVGDPLGEGCLRIDMCDC